MGNGEKFNSQPVENQTQKSEDGEQHVARLFDEMREASQPGRTTASDSHGQEWQNVMEKHEQSGVSQFVDKHTTVAQTSDGKQVEKLDARNISTEDLMKYATLVAQQVAEFSKVPEVISKKLAVAQENLKQFG